MTKTNMEDLRKKSLLPTNDVILHCLLGTVGNESITKAFLFNTIDKDVGELDLDLNLNLIREYYDSKLGVLDIRAKSKDGTNYNIEMQNTSSSTLPERILSYWSRLYTSELKRGNDYDILAKTIAVLIVNDNISRFSFIEKFHTKWNIREEDYKDVILTDDLEIHIIELPKYIKQKEIGKAKNIWLDFILNPNGKEVLDAMKNDKELKKANEEWRKITADDIIRDRALRLEIAELDRNTMISHAHKEGLEQGIEQGIETLILNMLNQDISIEEISKLTKIDIAKIKAISQKYKQKNHKNTQDNKNDKNNNT